MVGGDVTVAWMNHKYAIRLNAKEMNWRKINFYRSGKGYADDYYLDSKSQCAGRRGACPDKYVLTTTLLHHQSYPNQMLISVKSKGAQTM